MKPISSEDALLIFGKWLDTSAQLQLNIRKSDGRSGATPCTILETSDGVEPKVRLSIVWDGQSREWEIDLRGASFSYGEPLDSALFPEFAEGKWASYLLVEVPSGNSYLFAERFSEE